jgi:CubicO group peptidase (beta-lactamase class C family)
VSEDDVLFKQDFRKKLFLSDKTADGQLSNYSYGWALLETAQGPAIAHSGSWVGFRSYARFYPEKKVWIIIFSNFRDIPIREVLEQAEAEM